MTATPADDLSLAAQVDSACDRFESEFRANQHPRLEAYLVDVMEPNRSQLFRNLLEVELELRQSQGKSFSSEDYTVRFPEYRQIIDEAILHARETPGKRSSVIITGVETSRGPAAKKATSPAANVSLPLSKIGRFQVVTLLGEGAFGSVYKAHDPQLDREVAIKVPRSASHRSVEERERFLREGRAAAALHHPNICPVYEVGTTPEGRDYIVMAFIEGRPLSRVLQAPQRLSDRQIVNAVRRLALALEEAHAKGIIHRDLKPANIMINRKGEPVIMDFGLARRSTATDAQISHSGQIMGTPAYMSPEQARGDIKGVGPLSDLYSLGLVMYEMLCGRRPFEGTVTEVIGQILHVEPPPPSQFRKEIDPHLESICLKAIAKRPEDRFASMKDFATALSQYATSIGNTKPGIGSSPKDTLDSGDPLHTQQLAKLVAAVSSDVESKINRATGRLSGGGRPPIWVTLAGSGFMGLVVLLGVFFFVKNGDTTVIVQISLEKYVDDLKDPALSFLLDNEPIEADELESPIELKPGEHELIVNRDGKLFKRFAFTIDVGMTKNEPVAVQDVTPSRNQAPLVVQDIKPIGIKRLNPVSTGTTADFVPLFHGDSLTGWQGQHDLWSLREGVLTGQPTTGRSNTFLFSPRPYTDFELRFQTRIGESDNSGVQFRSDVLDPQKWTARGPQADIGNRQNDFWGGIYAEELPGGWLLKPGASPTVDPTDWNDYVIRCVGRRVTITVNGVTTVDGEIDVLQATGLLAFQIHRSNQKPVEFRQIQIRELGGEFADSQPLFNGRDLAGWKVSGAADWNVRDGAVFVDGSKAGVLTCVRQFEDFELTGEIYTTANSNGGILFRVSSTAINGKLGLGGYEFQVAGSQGDPGKNYTGGLYEGGQAISRVNPPVARDSTWIPIRLRVEGTHLQGWVDGRLTFDVQGKSDRMAGGILKLDSFAQGGEVGYRNFRIRPLADSAKSGPPSDARIFNGHAYKFFPEQLSWKVAKARCEAMGGRLAMVESLEENNFVSELVAAAGKVDAWIGATDEFSEGQWRWVDGHLMTWTNWFQDQKQPNNKGGVEHFGLMSNQKLANGKTIGWQWSDQPNESTQHQPGFVCEWDTLPAVGQ